MTFSTLCPMGCFYIKKGVIWFNFATIDIFLQSTFVQEIGFIDYFQPFFMFSINYFINSDL